ncbi:MAG: arylesterase [Alphaproteobacteria bacterium]|nr:arylesterase [Rhodospirillales bacterium]MCW9044719.1 arylesterase [Alphaproteobacteria bacterium]
MTSMAYGLERALVNATVAMVLFFALTFPAFAEGEIKILALGDSLTAGYGLEKQYSFTTQLENALKDKGHNVRIINGGVSGDTSAGGLSRLTWAMADKPDGVIIELGANDGLRGLDPAQTRLNLNAIINIIKNDGIPILLTGMLAPPNLGKEYSTEFNSIYSDLAQQNDISLYPFFLEGVAADSELNQADGIHPTAEGVAIIVKKILPYVEGLLQKQ